MLLTPRVLVILDVDLVLGKNKYLKDGAGVLATNVSILE